MLCYYGDDMEEYRRWEDNIKMDLKEVGVDVMSWLSKKYLFTGNVSVVFQLRTDGNWLWIFRCRLEQQLKLSRLC